MSKHNSLSPSSHGRCKCGRYMTLSEEKAGISGIGYTCLSCIYHKKLNRQNYYKQFDYAFISAGNSHHNSIRQNEL